MAIKIHSTSLSGVLLIDSHKFSDARGSFQEIYKKSEYQNAGLPEFEQDNLSFSGQNVLRGLHYQLSPKAQGKLVRVLQGRVWDVAADIRPNSPDFKRWIGFELTVGSPALFVPVGFAHGFVALEDKTLVHYKTTAEYDPALERGIRWDDPDLKIDWPVSEPVLAERDAHFPLLGMLQAADLPKNYD